MKKGFFKFSLIAVLALSTASFSPISAIDKGKDIVPNNVRELSKIEFEESRFGIFLHWGLYSTFAQGEWYMHNAGIDNHEYAKAASGFYPAKFNARDWVKAIKASGAKYICFTTRHHEGFSMFKTALSDYNIVDASPFGRDVVKELADACHEEGISLHLYYSHIDWTRDDYPAGRTGRETGKDLAKADWTSYYKFMNGQLTELLTNYGKIGAVWFDGWWDHDEDAEPFDWQLDEQYSLVHDLQPGCLVGNNHHQVPFPGEDIQIFERDLPGENKAGLSGQDISHLPLETCETMNGMWGYKVVDQNYKSPTELIHYLVKAAGKGANLLLNIGPQPNGELPATALQRLSEIGKWLGKYGETIYATQAGSVPASEKLASTSKGNHEYIHVLDPGVDVLMFTTDRKVKSVKLFDDGQAVDFIQKSGVLNIDIPKMPENCPDMIITIEYK